MKAIKLELIVFFCLCVGIAIAQPEFKGGQKALGTFIANSLIYPDYSKMNCLQGTVVVNFKLTGSGRVFNSGIESGFGTDLDEEALRIIQLTSGKWSVPTDHDSTLALLLPINFSLREYNCEQKSKEDIAASIAAYKAREGLTQGILNFYDRRENDFAKTDLKKAREIEELKIRLGYDNKFINATLRKGQQKLKQGDKESACEDFNFIRKLGSNKADKFLNICK